MGSNLKKDVFKAAEINEDVYGSDFKKLVEKYGYKEETLTLDQLRHVLSEEIQDLFVEMKRSS